MQTINRECAENLRDCIDNLYRVLFVSQKAAQKAGSGIDTLEMPVKIVPVIGSALRFLVPRNRVTCHDDSLLDMGCKVGLVFDKAEEYCHSPNTELLKVQFDALLVFGALLITLFLEEVEKGTLPVEVINDKKRIPLDALRNFLKEVPLEAVERVRRMPMGEIAEVSFFESDPGSRAYH